MAYVSPDAVLMANNRARRAAQGYGGRGADGDSESSSYRSALNSAADAIDTLSSIADANSARSANEARIQREWQEQQNAKAMQFNAQQAALNRDWQKMMSDTAHQREIADLKAAGLNPVLSAMGGNGAAVTSGATASGVTSAGAKGEVDTSMNSALVSLLAAVYNRTTQIEAANINARTQEAVADKYNATSEIVAQIAGAASMYGANAAAGASRYSADTQKFIAQNFPNTAYSLLSGILSEYGEGNRIKGLSGLSNGVLESGYKFGENLRKMLFGSSGSFTKGTGGSRR